MGDASKATSLWEALRAERSTDLHELVRSGQRLYEALQQALDQANRLKHDVVDLEAQVHVLEDQLDDRDDPDAQVCGAIRGWHDREHADAWMVCPHPVCREIVLHRPDVIADLPLITSAAS